jgi:hypothetical protein
MLHSPYTNQKKETERKFEQESRLKQSRDAGGPQNEI